MKESVYHLATPFFFLVILSHRQQGIHITRIQLPVSHSHYLISYLTCLYLFLLRLIKHSLPPHPAANQSATTTLCGLTERTQFPDATHSNVLVYFNLLNFFLLRSFHSFPLQCKYDSVLSLFIYVV